MQPTTVLTFFDMNFKVDLEFGKVFFEIHIRQTLILTLTHTLAVRILFTWNVIEGRMIDF